MVSSFTNSDAFWSSGEAGAATWRARVKTELSEGEPPRHAWDACGTAAQTLLGWRGDVNRYDLLCRCRAVFRIPVRAVKHDDVMTPVPGIVSMTS